MQQEFVPYEQALCLESLEFNEPCFKVYDKMGYLQDEQTMLNMKLDYCLAPLYQQAFRFFRKNYKYYIQIKDKGHKWEGIIIDSDNGNILWNSGTYYSPEEAELACLKELIEII